MTMVVGVGIVATLGGPVASLSLQTSGTTASAYFPADPYPWTIHYEHDLDVGGGGGGGYGETGPPPRAALTALDTLTRLTTWHGTTVWTSLLIQLGFTAIFWSLIARRWAALLRLLAGGGGLLSATVVRWRVNATITSLDEPFRHLTQLHWFWRYDAALLLYAALVLLAWPARHGDRHVITLSRGHEE